MESHRFEMVVAELYERGLVSSCVEEIEYSEYITTKAGDTHINRWKRKLKQFNREPTELAAKPVKTHAGRSKTIVLYSIIALIVLIVLLLNPQCPRRY